MGTVLWDMAVAQKADIVVCFEPGHDLIANRVFLTLELLSWKEMSIAFMQT